MACGWRWDVPDRYVVVDGGIPRSSVAMFHWCPTGMPDVEERGAIEAELVPTKPAHNFVIKL
jgi:hypothetical protein